MMQRQLRLIVRLVDDLLDVSRISRGKIELRRERVELNSLVREVVEAARALTQCDDQEITVESAPEPIYLLVDPTRIAQVIGNIVNNACKFSGDGGRISVIIETDGSSALIRTRDNGIGIAPDKRTMIFEMFTQIDTSLERTERGLGIGLALAKTLVELHDGEITVESEGPGRGSEFIVRLPLAGDTSEAPMASGHQVPRLSGRRILVVDDNHDSAAALAILLEMMGNETRTAHDGLSAYETALAFRPELMLLDIGLPRMNGYDVCRRIRKEPWGEAITIVALTGWGQKEDVRKSIEAGFNGHLVKPVELEALADVLADAEPASEGR
jgi:CheY-like chemotaxis protein